MTTVIQPYPVQTLFRTDLHKIIYPIQGKEAKNHTDPVSPREVLEGEISQGLLFSRMSVSLTKHTFYVIVMYYRKQGNVGRNTIRLVTKRENTDFD